MELMNKRILVIDDDKNICDLIRIYLENEGFDVRIAYNGDDGFTLFGNCMPDLVLLDIMLPGTDGWEVCQKIREVSDTPVIMITAKGEIYDRVQGLELGADDFVVKPFDMKELSARVKAVLRRTANEEKDPGDLIIRYDNLEINMEEFTLKLRGEKVYIPQKELKLLWYLAANRNRVFNRLQLLAKIWDYDYAGDSRTVDVHIKRLRKKLDGVSDKWTLKTVWGVGYKFEVLE